MAIRSLKIGWLDDVRAILANPVEAGQVGPVERAAPPAQS
jgi:hypothetical protein